MMSCLQNVAWALRKLRQYMLYFITQLISCWQMLLSEFDIMFVIRKAIKGQAMADYLVVQLSNDLEFSESLFLDEDFLAI